MNLVSKRIERLGQCFVREYQPGWESAMQARGFFLNDRRIPIFMTVVDTPPPVEQMAARMLPRLLAALHKALACVLADEEKRQVLLASLVNRQELLQLDIGRLPRKAEIFGRFDTFLRYKEDQIIPAVIEANFNNVEGLLFQHVSSQGGAELLTALDLADAYHFPSALFAFWVWMLACYRRSSPTTRPPTIGIIWEPGHMVKDVELPYAAENFRRWGYEDGIDVIAADWRELGHSPATGWTLKGRPVQIIWKNVGPYYPDDLIDGPYRYLARQDPADICVVSDVAGRLLGSKWLLETLWNPEMRGLYGREEWAAIRLMVPWTSEIRDGRVEGPDGETIPDLSQWILSHKDELVIKPVLGSHGEGVAVGLDTSPVDWEAVLGRAQEGRWIVMQFIAPEQFDLPIVDPQDNWALSWERLYADCNFYMFGSCCGPVVRRACQSRILNIAQETAGGRPAGGILVAASLQTGHIDNI